MTASTSTDEQRALRWARVRACLGEGLELQDEARGTFLQDLRRADAALADEVAELLALGDDSDGFLAGPPRAWVEELLEAPAAFDLAGRRVGAYRIVRRIGSGGMGEVYLGERADGSFEMQVAIKLMRDALPADADVSRFARERQILASLSHVNLAKILDGGVTDTGMPYFVMELVDGVPLDEYCATHQSTLAQRVALMHTICQVVHYVNQRGVVHRDLKPRNILVTASGVVKLLDFGIATRLDDGGAAAGTPRTRTALRTMTLLYASPEQVRGDVVGPASDVYALGVVMFKLLAQAQPYPIDDERVSSFELARAICDLEPRRMSEAAGAAAPTPARAAGAASAPAVPGVRTSPRAAARALQKSLRGDLDAVVAKALRKDPGARYASAEALADDLFRYRSRLPVRARQGALSYRTGRWLLKHRLAAGAAAAVNLALVAGLTVSLQQAHEARVQRERAQRNFTSVRALANVFLFDFYDAVSALPGAMAARRLVVDKAQTYLQSLSREAAADPALTMELAVSYRKIGDLQDAPGQPNLDDATGAHANYAHALDLLRPLLAGLPPDRPDPVRMEYSRTLSHQALLLYDEGQFAAAERDMREVLVVLDTVTRIAPDDTTAATARAITEGGLSWTRLKQGDTADFERYGAAAQQSLLAVLARDPDNAQASFNLASSYARQARFYIERDRTAQSAALALEAARKWRDLRAAQHLKDPGNPDISAGLSESEGTLAMALQRLGQPREALATMQHAVGLLAQERQLDPGDQNSRGRAVDAQATLAGILLDQAAFMPARDAARRAIADYLALATGAQAALDNKISAVQAYHHLAQAMRGLAAQERRPALARAGRRQACRTSEAGLALARSLRELPQASDGLFAAADFEAQLRSCAR